MQTNAAPTVTTNTYPMTAAGRVLPANPSRQFLYIVADEAINIGLGCAPVSGAQRPLAAGTAWNPTFPPADAIWICPQGGQVVNLEGDGIASTTALGRAGVPMLLPAGVANANTLGDAKAGAAGTVMTIGLGSVTALGMPSWSGGTETLLPSGIASVTQVGEACSSPPIALANVTVAEG
jgi:hypothetical protein